jgi:uncharacterized protein (DUF983 family)
MPDTQPIRWQPSGELPAVSWARPGLAKAMLRGAAGRCPCCGQTRLFCGWLKQSPACAACAAPLGAVRADDAPPYFVILLVAHFVIAAQVLLDMVIVLPLAAEAAIFLPLTLLLSLGLLRPVKGALIGLMLQFGMADTAPSIPANA